MGISPQTSRSELLRFGTHGSYDGVWHFWSALALFFLLGVLSSGVWGLAVFVCTMMTGRLGIRGATERFSFVVGWYEGGIVAVFRYPSTRLVFLCIVVYQLSLYHNFVSCSYDCDCGCTTSRFVATNESSCRLAL